MGQTHYKSTRLSSIGKDSWAYFSIKRAQRAVVFVHGWNGNAVDTWMQFQSLLQSESIGSNIDLFFFGYHSWRRTVQSSASSLYSFLEKLATSPRCLDRWPTGRDDAFHYRELILVAHSMGAIVTRRCLLTAFENKAPWASECKLVLYAPAHFGGTPLKLIPKHIRPAIEVLWPTLESLKEGSQLLRKLESDTRAALLNENASFLKAVKVVNGRADTVVSRHGDRFCEDAISDWIENADHCEVCSPSHDFLPPLSHLREIL